MATERHTMPPIPLDKCYGCLDLTIHTFALHDDKKYRRARQLSVGGFHNPLARKLGNFADFSKGDLRLLDDLSSNTTTLKAGTDLIKEGDRPDDVIYLIEGWAARYKILAGGQRQITAFLIPGDLCDIHIFILKKMDHDIGLLSDARVARIPKADMLALMAHSPNITKALWWATLVDEAVLREWLVNMGQRNAFQRIAHLFCELWVRLHQVGLTVEHSFRLPLNQEQLGDTIGLTPVHVNRTLQRMRAEGLITLQSRELVIQDISRLRQIADFQPNYLHLDRRSQLK